MLTMTEVIQIPANQWIFLSTSTGVQTYQWHIGNGKVPWVPSDLD